MTTIGDKRLPRPTMTTVGDKTAKANYDLSRWQKTAKPTMTSAGDKTAKANYDLSRWQKTWNMPNMKRC